MNETTTEQRKEKKRHGSRQGSTNGWSSGSNNSAAHYFQMEGSSSYHPNGTTKSLSRTSETMSEEYDEKSLLEEALDTRLHPYYEDTTVISLSASTIMATAYSCKTGKPCIVKFNTYEKTSQDTLNAIENDFYITKVLQDANMIHITKKKEDQDVMDEKYFPCTIHKIQHLYIHKQTYIMEKELFEAQTLYQHFHKEPLHDLIKFYKIAIGLCKCILQVHKQGIVHLDITPNNILYDDDNNELKVFNFENGGFIHTRGQYKFHRDKLYSTFEYIGAENTLGVQTDIYSLGAVFYFLLSGKKPFRGVTPKELIKQHAMDQLDKIPYVPQRVFHIILSMMRRNNTRNYMSLSEVILDLECIFSNKPFSSVQDFTFSHRFYGRELDLSALKTRYATFKSKRQSMITAIQGPPGIGKTMLIEQFSKMFQIPFQSVNTRVVTTKQLFSAKASFIFLDEIHHLNEKDEKRVRHYLKEHKHPCFIVVAYDSNNNDQFVKELVKGDINIKTIDLEPLPPKIATFFMNDGKNVTHGNPLHMHEASLLPPTLRHEDLHQVLKNHFAALPLAITTCLKQIAKLPHHAYHGEDLMKTLAENNRLVAKGHLYAILKTGFIVEVSYNVYAFLHHIYKKVIATMEDEPIQQKQETHQPPPKSEEKATPIPKHIVLRQHIEQETAAVLANPPERSSTPEGPPPSLSIDIDEKKKNGFNRATTNTKTQSPGGTTKRQPL